MKGLILVNMYLYNYPYYQGYQQMYYNNYAYDQNSNNAGAIAYIQGGPLAPNINGVVLFQNVEGGTIVNVEVNGLPAYKPGTDTTSPIGPHGFHIHINGTCEIGDVNEPFKAAGEHWNPDNQPHGNHAGDFPVLFSNDGYARMSFFTNRLKPRDVVGKAIIIHQNPDDYRSQPAGNAGKRLACGVIQAINM